MRRIAAVFTFVSLISVTAAWLTSAMLAVVVAPGPTAAHDDWVAAWQGMLIDGESWIINGYRRTGAAYIIAIKLRTAVRSERHRDKEIARSDMPHWSSMRHSFTQPVSGTPLMRHEFAYGWPMLAFSYVVESGSQIANSSALGAIRAPSWMHVLGNGTWIPMTPIWSGLIMNAALYFAVMLCFYTGIRRLVRVRRLKQSKCLQCGFYLDRGIDLGCSECGWRR